MTMLRWGAEIVGYELREDFANRAKANVRSFLGEAAMERYHVEFRDCYEGIDERGIDRVVLDLPEPWQVVPHAMEALRPGGILIAYTPRSSRCRSSAHARVEGVERDPKSGGAPPRLVRGRSSSSSRPPHGRPHRLPDHREVPRLTVRLMTGAPMRGRSRQTLRETAGVTR